MKKLNPLLIILSVLMAASLTSCGTYRYYQPTFNPINFRNAGEVHVSGEVANSGFSVKSSASVTKHLAVMGMYNAQVTQYRVREGEVGAGFYHASDNSCISGTAGLGFGSNFGYFDESYTTRAYNGKFFRPFVQFNAGAASADLGDVIYGDCIFSLKANYFSYEGRHLDGTLDRIRSRYMIIEPAMMFALGARAVRFNFTYGLPFRPSFEGLDRRTNARTFPLNIGFGMVVLVGVKKDDAGLGIDPPAR